MRQFKKIIQDVQNVSKITNVSKKKILIFSVAIMAQLTALTDIAIIAIFASIIADQFTGIDFINRIIIFILDFKILILFCLFFCIAYRNSRLNNDSSFWIIFKYIF